MNLDFLKDKKIAILGIAAEGKSVLEFLLAHGIVPTAVHDMKTETDPQTDALLKKNGVIYVGGENYLEDLQSYDVLFRSPGIPRTHPKILSFPEPQDILSVTKLFFRICPCPIIGVTGTKGKGTTSSLITAILQAAGRDVHLGGNIGQPPLEFFSKLTLESIVVLELSSFQLQDLEASPHIAVMLNITQDHLDHHRSVEEYREAKLSLLKFQKPEDYAVVSDLLPVAVKELGQGKKIIFSQQDGTGYETKLLGEHNKYNIAAAVKTAGILSVDEAVIRAAVAKFQGLKHRLQIVAVKEGVTYVNDSFSTNVDTTIAAIDSFKTPIILILGGSDKGLDYSELGKKIVNSSNIKALILIGAIAGKIQASVEGFTGTTLTGASDMREILAQVSKVSQSGDTVLLSPASASFGMFRDYKDRGNQFIQAVL